MMKKKCLYFLLLTLVLHVTPALAVIHSVWLDYDHTCDIKESFPVEPGDIVHFYTSLKLGDLVSVKTTVVNDAPNSKKYRWHIVNYNNRRISRKYFETLTTRIKIGSNPGWFQFKYIFFAIPTNNTAIFEVTDTTYCNKKDNS